jgi:hypothetical protein
MSISACSCSLSRPSNPSLLWCERWVRRSCLSVVPVAGTRNTCSLSDAWIASSCMLHPWPSCWPRSAGITRDRPHAPAAHLLRLPVPAFFQIADGDLRRPGPVIKRTATFLPWRWHPNCLAPFLPSTQRYVNHVHASLARMDHATATSSLLLYDYSVILLFCEPDSVIDLKHDGSCYA